MSQLLVQALLLPVVVVARTVVVVRTLPHQQFLPRHQQGSLPRKF
jgi:hypothetical protein